MSRFVTARLAFRPRSFPVGSTSRQVCYLVQKLAKRLGRKPYEFYLWIDYACINQQVRPPAEQHSCLSLFRGNDEQRCCGKHPMICTLPIRNIGKCGCTAFSLFFFHSSTSNCPFFVQREEPPPRKQRAKGQTTLRFPSLGHTDRQPFSRSRSPSLRRTPPQIVWRSRAC